MVQVFGITKHTRSNWCRAGQIPYKEWFDLIMRARQAGIALSPQDFIADLVEAIVAAEMAQQTTAAAASPAQQPA